MLRAFETCEEAEAELAMRETYFVSVFLVLVPLHVDSIEAVETYNIGDDESAGEEDTIPAHAGRESGGKKQQECESEGTRRVTADPLEAACQSCAHASCPKWQAAISAVSPSGVA